MCINLKHTSIYHILSNKVTVTALWKEGVRETFLLQSLMKPVVGKGKKTIRHPSYMLCLEKHEIGLKKSATFFSFDSGLH